MKRPVQLILAIAAMTLINLPVYAKPIPSQHKAFINALTEIVQLQNAEVEQSRKQILQWRQRKHLTQQQLKQLQQVARSYGLTQFDASQSADWSRLLKRVDTIPTALVLAQAINESAWGTSRFATQGNNLFGTWCFQAGCGIVPLRADSTRYFEVKAYPNPTASVRDYFRNINSNHHYQALREARYQQHQQQQAVTGMMLAYYLDRYSARGNAYVDSIQHLIKLYHLDKLPS